MPTATNKYSVPDNWTSAIDSSDIITFRFVDFNCATSFKLRVSFFDNSVVFAFSFNNR